MADISYRYYRPQKKIGDDMKTRRKADGNKALLTESHSLQGIKKPSGLQLKLFQQQICQYVGKYDNPNRKKIAI